MTQHLTSLVERLRARYEHEVIQPSSWRRSNGDTFKEAADTIEALNSEVMSLREALEPFAFLADKIAPEVSDDAPAFVSGLTGDYWVKIGALRKARASLQERGG